jgi:AcrR family transcriptional regulator
MVDNPGSTEQTAKQDILKHARTLFSKKGFEAVSVREISKESGQNISMISYYFGGKEGLYKAILSDHMFSVTGQVNTIFAKSAGKEMTAKSFREDMKSMVAIIVDMKFQNPEMMMIMQRERVNGLPFARELHDQIIGPYAEQIVEVFKSAQRKKVIRSGFDPGVFMGVLFESIFGFMTAYDCGIKALKSELVFPRDKDKFVDFLTDLFLEGIMK